MRKSARGPLHTCLAVTGAYVGAVVGGGFATGREVLHFFAIDGAGSLAALAVGLVGFAGFGAALMLVIVARRVRSLRDAVALFSRSPQTQKLFDTALFLFYLVVIGVVMSASAALAAGHGLQPALGVAIMAGSIVLVTRSGTIALLTVNTILLVVLTATILITALRLGAPFPVLNYELAATGPSVSPLLYVSYNMIFALSVFPDLGREGDSSWAVMGATCGGLILGLLVWAEWRIMVQVLQHVAGLNVPLEAAIELLAPEAGRFFPLLIGLSLLTTGAALTRGLASRFGERQRPRVHVLGVILLPAIALARFDLASLVATVYPLMGWLTLLFWLQIFRQW